MNLRRADPWSPERALSFALTVDSQSGEQRRRFDPHWAACLATALWDGEPLD